LALLILSARAWRRKVIEKFVGKTITTADIVAVI
jgi:hypothetical protein